MLYASTIYGNYNTVISRMIKDVIIRDIEC